MQTRDFSIGQSLGDFHGKNSRCPPEELTHAFEIVSAIQLDGPYIGRLIDEVVSKETDNKHFSRFNKICYVIGEDRRGNIIAAYSYDGMRGEMMTLKIKE